MPFEIAIKFLEISGSIFSIVLLPFSADLKIIFVPIRIFLLVEPAVISGLLEN